MKNLIIYILTVISVIVLSGSCRNRSIPDISNINTELVVKRLEKDLFAIQAEDIDNQIQMLEKKYGKFFDLYNFKIITIGGSDEKDYEIYLKQFLDDKIIKQIYNKCEEIFPDITEIEEALNQSFSFYKYYFPYRQLPDIYTFISGFNQSVVTDEKILGIGLDKYFGDTCDFYTRLAWPNYIKKNMQPEKIVSDCMKAWAFMEFDSGRPNINQEIIKNNAINHMLFHGKIMYFLDAVLPYEEDSLKIGFSNNQLEWCQNNEAQMWDYLIENKLLFSTELLTIRKLVEDAPFTSYFTDQSPGRAGVWIGWQIIKSYMKKNNCSLEELMLENDYQKIMTISGYNPKQ